MDIDSNTDCYNFKEIDFEKGVFDETIDCTYIIHLVGNGRLNRIYDEINKTNTTKKIIIAMNKGYKKCNKKLIEQQPYQDLTDAFLQCMKNAKSKGFKNILILEDDFIFDDKLKDKTHVTNINKFIKSKKNDEYVYYIGVIPIITYPTTYLHTFNVVKSLTMHSVIYSEQIIQNYDKLDLSYKHWDVIIDKNIRNKYAYYTPLCYQTFPETENRKTWAEKDNATIINEVKTKFIKAFNMDKTPINGFLFCYYFSFFLFLMVSILSLFIIGMSLRYVIKNSKPMTNYKGITRK